MKQATAHLHHLPAPVLERRDAILSALSWAAATLLNVDDWRAALAEMLARLGRATDVSRVYLYENVCTADGQVGAASVGSWSADHAPPRPPVSALRERGYSPRFAHELGEGRLIQVHTNALAQRERAVFASHHVQSMLGVPVFADGAWWGMLGFDECRAERIWTQPEFDALRAAAPILGGAIARDRREAALRERATHYRDLAGLGADWYWEQDRNLRFTYLSPDVEAVSGFRAEVFLGKTRHETQPDGVSDAQWRQHLEELAARQPFHDFRFERVDPQGRRHWYSSSGTPVLGPDGEFRGYRGIGRDITAQIEAEQALRAKEAELQASHRTVRDALESISEGFSLWDAEDRLVLWNQRHVEIFPTIRDIIRVGVPFAEVLRHNVEVGAVLTGDRSAEEHIRAGIAVHRAGGNREVRMSDGRVIAVREHATAEGGIVRLDIDVSDMKRREEALVEAREQAEAANRAKSSFIANMSHELRTPLNAIIGFSDILRAQMFGALAPKYREYADDISRSGAHLLTLINDLLDTAKIEAGKYQLRRELLAVGPLVEETTRLLSTRAAEAGVRLVNGVPADLPRWSMDRRAVGQVLMNLLSNAVKFSRAGGEARVTAGIVDDRLELAVSDQGIGIPAAELPRLARPFEQVENVWTRSREGSGLGLAICKSLVELHGGGLRIESRLGHGTVVTLHIPR